MTISVAPTNREKANTTPTKRLRSSFESDCLAGFRSHVSTEQMQGLSEHLKNVQEQLFTKFGDSVVREYRDTCRACLRRQSVAVICFAARANLTSRLPDARAHNARQSEEKTASAMESLDM